MPETKKTNRINTAYFVESLESGPTDGETLFLMGVDDAGVAHWGNDRQFARCWTLPENAKKYMQDRGIVGKIVQHAWIGFGS